MMESFVSMQDLINFAKTAQGDFSYRWYGERFTETIRLNPAHAERNYIAYAPVSPKHWHKPNLELVPNPKHRKPRQ
jgi:hypothetical protein